MPPFWRSRSQGLPMPICSCSVVGAILGQHGDIRDTGVDTVAQGKINDAILASEWNRGLGTFLREETQSLSLAPGQNNR